MTVSKSVTGEVMVNGIPQGIFVNPGDNISTSSGGFIQVNGVTRGATQLTDSNFFGSNLSGSGFDAMLGLDRVRAPAPKRVKPNIVERPSEPFTVKGFIGAAVFIFGSLSAMAVAKGTYDNREDLTLSVPTDGPDKTVIEKLVSDRTGEQFKRANYDMAIRSSVCTPADIENSWNCSFRIKVSATASSRTISDKAQINFTSFSPFTKRHWELVSPTREFDRKFIKMNLPKRDN